MAIVTMKRLRLLAMREDREALLDDLQRLGCVEVSEPTLDGREEESGAAELLSHLTPPDAQALSQAQTRRQEAERAMGILKHYGAKGRGLLTPRPQTSKEELCSPQAAARQDQAVAGVLAEERQVNALLAQGEKLASQRAALAPWLALALLAFSLLCAFGYSRYITRPIVRLNGIAGRMAELDLQWVCGERRRDEIGQLGRSLDKMARRLSAALTDLETANQALRGEVARERELDRQRMAFFSAASHELKTPVTILKGQLAGMLEGVGVYQDRDKYLLRSLQTTGRMERLIGEMLSISRMESGSAAVRQEPVDLSALMAQQLALDRELLEQRGQQLVSALTPGITVPADASLLGKAVGNLLSNASRYSPEGAEIRVWCGRLEGRPALSVENTGARVSGDALPHLFEAFYREEGSRNRSTGGSGLGLYLVKMILDRHGAVCTIENTEEGVKATVRF